MKALNALLRWYAYIYFFLLSAFLAGLGIVAYASGMHNINTGGMATTTGEALSKMLLIIGLCGILAVILAVLGKFRWLLQGFAILAVIGMFRALFVSSYRYDSAAGFQGAAILFLGAIVAAACTFLRKPVRHGVHHSARK